MFQFPGLPSHRLCIHLWILKHYLKCVPAFGNLRINGYLLLPAAYRSLSRPSSAPSAKASALCSSSLDQKWCLTSRLSQDFLYYCFTRSENFLVFSVNHWNCILLLSLVFCLCCCVALARSVLMYQSTFRSSLAQRLASKPKSFVRSLRTHKTLKKLL